MVPVSGLLAVVQTAVMIMGGIDLTVGSVAGLSSVVSAMVFTATNAYLGILVALLLGGLCGLVNAIIIVAGRVPPMIATLAGLTAFKGIAQLISDGRAQGYTGADPLFKALARGSLLGIPTLMWVLIVVAILMTVLVYGAVALALTLGFVGHAIAVWRTADDETAHRAARKMFRYSLVYLAALFAALPIDLAVSRIAG